ncbi:SDR family NAD(P)-dependent oxidoreductase [Gorillibacterium sp. sgz500922]|uniref:SDR family NAD(P)-dependent oxidoreductase n=1 Tax=Gorillibacterium sp. sgz500922 TaxID=3446694 RepID=UPI003F6754CD
MNAAQGDTIALITGASSGIGLELTRKLLSENWQVIALNRSDLPAGDRSLQQAVDRGSLRLYKAADLADYDSLRTALHEIKAKERRIDGLFNNAGGSFPELSYSKQGRETHYELMTVVPYLILMEVKELIANSRLRTVINTSSSAVRFVKTLTIESLEQPSTFRKLTGPYAASKLALSLWSQAAAPRLLREGIAIRSVDPGGNNTLRKGKRSGLPFGLAPIMKLFFSPPAKGADRLYEGAVGEHREETGVFLVNNRVTKPKFSDMAQAVLERVDTIYRHDYLGE